MTHSLRQLLRPICLLLLHPKSMWENLMPNSRSRGFLLNWLFTCKNSPNNGKFDSKFELQLQCLNSEIDIVKMNNKLATIKYKVANAKIKFDYSKKWWEIETSHYTPQINLDQKSRFCNLSSHVPDSDEVFLHTWLTS